MGKDNGLLRQDRQDSGIYCSSGSTPFYEVEVGREALVKGLGECWQDSNEGFLGKEV